MFPLVVVSKVAHQEPTRRLSFYQICEKIKSQMQPSSKNLNSSNSSRVRNRISILKHGKLMIENFHVHVNFDSFFTFLPGQDDVKGIVKAVNLSKTPCETQLKQKFILTLELLDFIMKSKIMTLVQAVLKSDNSKSLAAALFYGTCSVSMNFLNKAVVSSYNFNYPFFIMVCQMVTTIIFLDTLR